MKTHLLIFPAVLLALGLSVPAVNAAAAKPATLPAKRVVKKKMRAKARKRIRSKSEVAQQDAPPGVIIQLPALTSKDRATTSFQRATTPKQGGVVMRAMSKTEYAEYAAAADREAQAAELVQRKKIAPPLPVEKLVIDDLEKQILAEVTDAPKPEPKPGPKQDGKPEPVAVTTTAAAPEPLAPPQEPAIEEIPVPEDSILIGAFDPNAEMPKDEVAPAMTVAAPEAEPALDEAHAFSLDPVEQEALDSLD